MRFLLAIMILSSCTSTKTFLLDGSASQGNIVKYEWQVNNERLSGVKTKAQFKKATIMLIVTDDMGRKDTATIKIK